MPRPATKPFPKSHLSGGIFTKKFNSHGYTDLIKPLISIVVIIVMVSSILAITQDHVEDSKGQVNTTELGASYIIYQDGMFTCAKNGQTSRIDFKSSDASAVIQSAMDAGPGTIYIKSGKYVIDHPLIPRSDRTIAGPGELVLGDDCQFIVSNDDRMTVPANEFNTYVMLDSYKMTKDIVLDDVSSFGVGDVVKISSSKVVQDTSVGEINRVEAVDTATNTIRLALPLAFDYLAADNATLTHITKPLKNFNMHGLTLTGWSERGMTDQTVGVRLFYAVDCTLRDLRVSSFGYEGITAFYSYNIRISDCTVSRIELAGTGYGAKFVASTGCIVESSTFSWCRHGTDAGHLAGIWSRDISFIDNQYLNTEFERVHTGVIGYQYRNCLFDGVCAVLLSGINGEISDSIISNAPRYDWRGQSWPEALNVGQGQRCTNVVISGLSEVGKRAVTLGANSTIHNTKISGFSEGIMITGDHTVISNCDVSVDVGSVVYQGAGIISDITITDSRLITKGSRWELSAVTLWSSEYVRMDNCEIISGVRGVYLGNHSSITNCIIDPAETGYSLMVRSDSVISGNTIHGLLETKNSEYIRISNNVFMPGYPYSIILTNVNNITLSGNIFRGDSQYGYVRVDNSEDVFFDGNRGDSRTKDVYVNNGGNVRVLINGIGTNGAFDPAVGGEWYGHEFEGLMVTWTDGEIQYLSAYRGGKWWDWVVT